MILDQGQGNIIVGAEGFTKKYSITLSGDNNRITLGSGFSYKSLDITVRASDTEISIGENCTGGAITLILGSRGSRVRIGRNLKVNGLLWASVAGNRMSIEMGDDCLIASARMRTSDHHRIFPKDGTEQINKPAPIVIGDRVWLGDDVLVLKGAQIGSGSVIGARSLVNRSVPPDSLAAGVPVRVIREEIRWEY